MDNITHSLIGLIVGESVARPTSGSASALTAAQRRVAIISLATVGNNLPDIDLMVAWPGRVRYMLEHRGYTHTIVGCVVLALLLYAGVAAWLARRNIRLTRGDNVTFFSVALVGVALHLGMDSLNSYGVHPFWPLDNGWVYGDSVFIVEPWYWAAAAPLLVGLRSRAARIVLGLLLAVAVMFCLVRGAVAEPIPMVFGASMLVFLVVGWRVGPRAASLVSAALFFIFTIGFVAAGRIAAGRVEAAVRADFPTDRMLDHVLTPMPVNPLCWDVLVLQSHEGVYIARRTTLALTPRIISTVACEPSLLSRPSFVPQTALPVSPRTGLRWREFEMPRTQLTALALTHCEAVALLQFARAPFALRAAEGWIIGDLRFDRGNPAAFPNINIGPGVDVETCPKTPPWVPPRQDLLGPD